MRVRDSPFMRCVGYVILCDWLDFPALHERAGAHARRWLRRVVLGLEAPGPESLPPWRGAPAVGFALGPGASRLVGFVGIPGFVHTLFFTGCVLYQLYAVQATKWGRQTV